MADEKTSKFDLVIATVLYVIVIIIFVLLVIDIGNQKSVVKKSILSEEEQTIKNGDTTIDNLEDNMSGELTDER